MKIINVGSVPPPYGGITIFLKRLKEKTDNIDSKKYIYYDVSGLECDEKRKRSIVCTSRYRVFFHLLKEPKESYVIFHSNSVGHLVIQKLLQRKLRFIYFTHGESIIKEKNKKGWRYKTLKKADYIVTPTEELYKKCSGIFEKNKIMHIPFILFPDKVKELQNEVITQLKSKTDFLMCGYACHLDNYNRVQLYGTDMMAKLVHELRERGYNVGCICLISDTSNQKAFNQLKMQVKEYGIEDYFMILDKKIEEAIELYNSVDLYVRPTNTDGDSFSIWESLYTGTPVLASDATQRPRGCYLFKKRDDTDFLLKAINIIENYKTVKNDTKQLEIKGNEDMLIDFFDKLI